MNKEFESELATFDLECIPLGTLSLDMFLESVEGKAAIDVLKGISTDPTTLIIPLLAAYQVMDIVEQLKAKGCIVEPGTEEKDMVLRVASKGVVQNIVTIVNSLGEESLHKIIQALSPEGAIH